MNGELSDADRRVINCLRRGRKSTAEIARDCFSSAGKGSQKAVRPAAAHLARMQERQLVLRHGADYPLWELAAAVENPGPELF